MSPARRRPGLWLAAALAVGAGGLGGCGTCRPDRPPVQPQAGGAVGVEVGHGGGWWSDVGIGLDVSNLFCRRPPPEAQHEPGPGSEPLPDGPQPETPPPTAPEAPPPATPGP